MFLGKELLSCLSFAGRPFAQLFLIFHSSSWCMSILLLATLPAQPLSHLSFWGGGRLQMPPLLGCGLSEAKSALLCPLPANWVPAGFQEQLQGDGLRLLNPLASGCFSWLRASRMTNSTPTNLTFLAICLLAK